MPFCNFYFKKPFFYREKELQPLRKCNRCDYTTRNRDRLRSHKITNCDFKRKEFRGISERKMGRPKKIRYVCIL